MKYLAHIEGEREQSLKEHLVGTCLLYTSHTMDFILWSLRTTMPGRTMTRWSY